MNKILFCFILSSITVTASAMPCKGKSVDSCKKIRIGDCNGYYEIEKPTHHERSKGPGRPCKEAPLNNNNTLSPNCTAENKFTCDPQDTPSE